MSLGKKPVSLPERLKVSKGGSHRVPRPRKGSNLPDRSLDVPKSMGPAGDGVGDTPIRFSLSLFSY